MPLALLAAAAVSLSDQLIDLEKQSWVAWQAHDAAFFGRFLSDDHVEVGAAGPYGKKVVVAGVAAGCTVKSYSVDHFTVTKLGPDSALVTYRAAQDTTCGGSAVPSPVWATSLYMKRQGRWQNVLYEHVPIPKPAP